MNANPIRSLIPLSLLLCGLADTTWAAGPIPPDAYVMQQASAIVDARGGVVEVSNAASPLYGTRVEIPAGAVAQATEISINLVSSGSGYPGDVLVTDIEPYDLKLSAPAIVRLRYSPQYLYDNYLEDAQGMKVLPVDARDSVVPDAMLEPVANDATLGTVTISTTVLGSLVPLSFSKATLNGSYQFVNFSFDRSTTQAATPSAGLALPLPKGFRSMLGTFAANGSGGYNITQSGNQDGSLTSKSSSGNYTVSSTGTFAISTSKLSGQVLAGGSVVIFASNDVSKPGMFVGIKKSGSFSKASLKGSYQFVNFSYDRNTVQAKAPSKGQALPLPKGFRSMLGTFNANGSGGYSLSQSMNQDGKITSKSSSGSYTVSSTGAFTIVSGDLTGQVLAGGNVVIFSSTDTDKPGIFIGIKKGGTFSAASLNGSYQFVNFTYDRATTQGTTPAKGLALPLPKGFRSLLGTFTADGAGNYSLSQSANQDGSLSSKASSGTYTVSSAGAFSIVGGNLTGQVLSGGNIVIFASTDVTKPGIFVGIKK